MIVLLRNRQYLCNIRRKIMEQRTNIKFRKFLVSKSILILNHASYSSDLILCDYLPKTKNKATGKAVWHFDDFKNFQRSFTTAFLELYDRCKHCISSDFIIIYNYKIYNYYLIEWILMKIWKLLGYILCVFTFHVLYNTLCVYFNHWLNF